MLARTIFFTLFFGLLAASALVGAVTFFSPPNDSALAPIITLCISTLITSALLLPFAVLSRSPNFRTASLFALTLIFILWSLVNFLIVNTFYHPGSSSDQLYLLLAFLLLTGIPSTAALFLMRFPWARFAAPAFLLVAAAALLLFVSGLFLNASGNYIVERSLPYRLLFAGLATLIAGPIAFALLTNIGSARHRLLPWPGLASLLAYIALVLIETISPTSDEFHTRALLILLALAVVPAHINLILMARLQRFQIVLQAFTILTSIAAGAFFLIHFLLSANIFLPESDSLPFKIAPASLAITCCSTLALILLATLNPTPRRS